MELYLDLKRRLPGYTASVIFDVGAYVGRSTETYLRWFPDAEIYCFEPVTYSFAKLQERLGKFDNVHCFRLAAGRSKSVGEMVVQGASSMNALVQNTSPLSVPTDAELQTVEIIPLSEFCLQQGIERISFLKIDTEGHDFEVLRGAESMLDDHRIDLIQVEASMNPTNQDHIPFEEFKTFLEDKGYYIFGIYDQVHEWLTKKPNLRRTNLVFLSKTLLEQNL